LFWLSSKLLTQLLNVKEFIMALTLKGQRAASYNYLRTIKAINECLALARKATKMNKPELAHLFVMRAEALEQTLKG
jgi:hypothetical protein